MIVRGGGCICGGSGCTPVLNRIHTDLQRPLKHTQLNDLFPRRSTLFQWSLVNHTSAAFHRPRELSKRPSPSVLKRGTNTTVTWWQILPPSRKVFITGDVYTDVTAWWVSACVESVHACMRAYMRVCVCVCVGGWVGGCESVCVHVTVCFWLQMTYIQPKKFCLIWGFPFLALNVVEMQLHTCVPHLLSECLSECSLSVSEYPQYHLKYHAVSLSDRLCMWLQTVSRCHMASLHHSAYQFNLCLCYCCTCIPPQHFLSHTSTAHLSYRHNE